MTLETVNTLSLCCSHCRCVATISWVYLLVQFKHSKVSKLERFTNSNTWTWGTGLKISEFFSNVLHCPSPRSWSHSWCHVPDQSRKSWPLYGRSIGHFWQQRLCECTIHTQKKNVFPQFELLCRGYETLTLQSLWNDFLLYFLFCCIFHADWLFFWNSSDFVDGQDFFGSCCCKESAAFSVLLKPVAQSLTFLAARKSRPWATWKENLSKSSMSSGQSTVSSHKETTEEESDGNNVEITGSKEAFHHILLHNDCVYVQLKSQWVKKG